MLCMLLPAILSMTRFGRDFSAKQRNDVVLLNDRYGMLSYCRLNQENYSINSTSAAFVNGQLSVYQSIDYETLITKIRWMFLEAC